MGAGGGEAPSGSGSEHSYYSALAGGGDGITNAFIVSNTGVVPWLMNHVFIFVNPQLPSSSSLPHSMGLLPCRMELLIGLSGIQSSGIFMDGSGYSKRSSAVVIGLLKSVNP